jgi:hypothetical protein
MKQNTARLAMLRMRTTRVGIFSEVASSRFNDRPVLYLDLVDPAVLSCSHQPDADAMLAGRRRRLHSRARMTVPSAKPSSSGTGIDVRYPPFPDIDRVRYPAIWGTAVCGGGTSGRSRPKVALATSPESHRHLCRRLAWVSGRR